MISIIAIHGLDTGSPRTWEAYETEDASGPRGRTVNWLSDDDMLPFVIPEGRIFTFDWDSDTHIEAPVASILGQADNLLDLVTHERRAVRAITQ